MKGGKAPAHGDRGGADGAKALVGNVPAFTVKRTPSIPKGATLQQVCASCGARPGEKCRAANGKPTSAHPPRRRLATRAWNLQREAEGTLGVRLQDRGDMIDMENGRVCPDCRLTIRLAKGRRVGTLLAHTRTGSRDTASSAPRCSGSGHVFWDAESEE